MREMRTHHWEERTVNTEGSHAWRTVHGIIYSWGNGGEEAVTQTARCSHKFSHGGTVNILCLDSGLREVAVWSVEKALREWIPEWMQATDLGTASQGFHSLRLWYGKAFLLGLRQVLTVCVENLHHSYPPLDIYGLKTPPLERLLLLR